MSLRRLFPVSKFLDVASGPASSADRHAFPNCVDLEITHFPISSLIKITKSFLFEHSVTFCNPSHMRCVSSCVFYSCTHAAIIPVATKRGSKGGREEGWEGERVEVITGAGDDRR